MADNSHRVTDLLSGAGARVPRREFLSGMGMGFAGLALGSMLWSDGIARAETQHLWAPPNGMPHFPPKAKSVIWIFLAGGMSQVDTFDPKPALTKYAGLTLEETPFKKQILESPYFQSNLRRIGAQIDKGISRVLPVQTGFRKRGASGIEISDWWPHLGDCIDEVAIVRSMWTTNNNHGAQLQFHTGRHMLEGFFPTIGSWVHYGLGSLNENLPQFVAMGTPLADCCGGQRGGHGADYLGPRHSGVPLRVDPRHPLDYSTPGSEVFEQEQAGEFHLLRKLHKLGVTKRPTDPAILARIESYELAFRMQMAVPELVSLDEETAETQKLYGLDQKTTREFGSQCLVARRLVERGVRFVQIYHGTNGSAGAWDAHGSLKAGHSLLCSQIDQPIAALIKDLKRTGLLEETMIVLGTDFGRTPGGEGRSGTANPGRDHHPYGFSVMMAGGGLKGGIAHGATDELGFHAVEDRHYVTDIHATLMHQLGLNARRLEVPGRKRLDVDYGRPIHDIIA